MNLTPPNRNARTIEQTKEVVVALVACYDRWNAINEDNKRTWLEYGGLTTLLPAVWGALQGIGEVPKELADLAEEEIDDIIRTIAPSISSQLESNAMRRKVDKLLVVLHALVDAQAEWRGVNSPVPEIVPE